MEHMGAEAMPQGETNRTVIALVDDDRNILTSVSIALEAEGFGVDTYTDGEQALRGIGQIPVDLAVLDIKMPRMDGLEVLRQIREHDELKRLPVVILSSSREESDLARSWDMGVNAYVVKPVDVDQFFGAVQTLGKFWALINQAPELE